MIYRIPEDRTIQAEVIRSIPEDWCWLDGGFYAPKRFYDEELVAPNTRISLSRYAHTSEAMELKLLDEQSGKHGFPAKDKLDFTDLTSLLLQGKRCSSIVLNEVGFERKGLRPWLELTSAFVQQGYGGTLSAYSDYIHNNKYDNPESIFFGTDGVLKLYWDEKFKGAEKNLEGVMKCLEGLGLRQEGRK